MKEKQLKGENDSKIRREKARPNIAKLNKVLFWIYLKEDWAKLSNSLTLAPKLVGDDKL